MQVKAQKIDSTFATHAKYLRFAHLHLRNHENQSAHENVYE